MSIMSMRLGKGNYLTKSERHIVVVPCGVHMNLQAQFMQTFSLITKVFCYVISLFFLY
jgi:hypothetical protein